MPLRAIIATVRVEARHASGSAVACFADQVALSIATGPGGALSGTTTVSAVGGIATFSDLSIDKAGNAYSFSATASGLTPATSTAFNITPGPSIQIAFTVQPSDATAGATMPRAVEVSALDSLGNTLTSFTSNVTVAIETNPAGANLSGTTTVAAVAGVATFNDLIIDKSGTGYTLLATSDTLTSTPSAAFNITAPNSGSLPRFGHEIIVLEENHDYSSAIDSAQMPYLHSLLAQGGLATQYFANTHPSIGNYFMLTTGQIITNNDGYSQTVPDDNIVRALLAAGKTWKSYAEDLPSVGFTGSKSGKYARKHNPLAFFSDVVNDSVQVKNLVPFTQFATDLANGTLPNYSFVVPNLCNDAHDCSLQTADGWLQTNIAPLIASPVFQADGLLIIVFDEAETDNTYGGGRVLWMVVSPKAKPGYSSSALYQHESTLRLLAEGLGLTSYPGAAATASNMSEFFNP